MPSNWNFFNDTTDTKNLLKLNWKLEFFQQALIS